MLVTVTGGTGFVGSHSVAAIRAAGHQVRLLARDPRSAPSDVDVVTGDVTDPAAVRAAVRGADAVLHAASVYSFDSRQHGAVRRTNEYGTTLVLDEARRAVPGPIVHVSSVVALFPPAGGLVDVHSPVGRPRETYAASKAAAEVVARRHQADGAPVVITYPPALLGPDDPRLGDQTGRLRNVLRGLMPVWPTGGLPVGDVRDTATLHAALLGNAGPSRHFGPAHDLSTREYVAAIRAVTGRALPTAFLPARAMLPFGALTDVLQRVWPKPIPAEYGAIYVCACAARVGADRGGLGIGPRPVAATIRDTVAWLHAAGKLTAAQAGAAVGAITTVAG